MFDLVGMAKRAAYEVGYRDPAKWLWLFKHKDAQPAFREHGLELEQSMFDGSFSMRRTYDEEEGGQGKGVEEEIS